MFMSKITKCDLYDSSLQAINSLIEDSLDKLFMYLYKIASKNLIKKID